MDTKIIRKIEEILNIFKNSDEFELEFKYDTKVSNENFYKLIDFYKKQKLKILLDSSVKNTLGKDREKEKFTEVKYMPKGYISPGAIDVFQDYVYIFLWEEKPYVFMIKNQRIADSFKQYFNFLWRIAKNK